MSCTVSEKNLDLDQYICYWLAIYMYVDICEVGKDGFLKEGKSVKLYDIMDRSIFPSFRFS